MKEKKPSMDIRFPEGKDTELFDKMCEFAEFPWEPSEVDAMGRPRTTDNYYFHRARAADHPACMVCIGTRSPGHWYVVAIVPDEGEVATIPISDFKSILTEFESEIAEPASESLGGTTAIEYSTYRLEDNFSAKAVKLLENFCASANQGDLGAHLSDQARWNAFLICAYRDGSEVHCDIFGYCLSNARWWPDHDVSRLVSQYDFAMILLEQAGVEKRNPN